MGTGSFLFPVLILCAATVVTAGTNAAQLRVLTAYTDSLGARCLDGSAPAYYYTPGSGASADSWLLFIEGGGWCYDEEECYGRSLTSLGSSSTYNTTQSDADGMGGMWSSNCSTNPLFCDWTKILIKYCDGTSFTSNLTTPLAFNNTNLYFRGRNNLQAVLTDLANLTYAMVNNSGWLNATEVVLSGCSAGGLSTYHAADWVGARLSKSVKKYAAIPVSGFFLLQSNVLNVPVYPQQMASLFTLANMSAGVSQKCLAKNPTAPWVCIFAQNALPYIKTPIFILNSAFDYWQLLCEYYADADTCAAYWPNCSETFQCSPTQWVAWNAYGASFTKIINGVSNYRNTGNGGFIHSCVTHCEAISDAWNLFNIEGMTMQAAVWRWWNLNGEGNQWYADCQAYSMTAPYTCNPSCGGLPSLYAWGPWHPVIAKTLLIR